MTIAAAGAEDEGGAGESGGAFDRAKLVADLTARLGEGKAAFLSELRAELSEFIRSQGPGCLAIIERRASGPVTWALEASPAYAKRLVAFCRGKTFEGNELDSALTEPVIERISAKFSAYYQRHEAALAEALTRAIMNDAAMARALVDGVVGTAAQSLSEGAKQKLAALLMEPIREAAGSVLGSATTQAAAQTVVASVKSAAAHVSAPVAAKVAMLLVQSLSATLKFAVAKVLSSAVLKAAIAAAVKKFLIAAIVGAVVKLIATKLGISTLGAFAIVLIPVVAAYIAYEVYTFPKALGEKVSEKVVEDLGGSFDKINASTMEQVLSEVFANGMGGIGAQIGKSEAVQGLLAELVRSIAPG